MLDPSSIDPALKGAAAGASIATLYSFKRDGILKSLIRWLSGVWFGSVATYRAIMWLDWEPSDANLLFVASGIGLGAFVAIQIILADKTKAALQSGAKAIVSKYSGAKE